MWCKKQSVLKKENTPYNHTHVLIMMMRGEERERERKIR